MVGLYGNVQVTMDATEKNKLAAANLKALRSQWELSRDRVISLLEERGISLHVNSLRRIEEGLQPLKLQESIAFADIYGITLDELINSPMDWPTSVLSFEAREGEVRIDQLLEALEAFAYSVKTSAGSLAEFRNEHSQNEKYRELERKIGPWSAGLKALKEPFTKLNRDVSCIDSTLDEVDELLNGSR